MSNAKASSDGSSTNAVRDLGSGRHRIRTPTHPTEGDYLSLKVEELIFGALFAFMAYKLWQSVRGLFRYWKYVRALNAPEVELGVEDEGFSEGEESDAERTKRD